ncbi:MFS transporter [Methanocella conradii]|uniref:MFS transporter n=1 Tax=Methanocella conradii TaxID=1175444 RepID=UPI00157DE68C|nr:MFS transporter [Methanocella conradii]
MAEMQAKAATELPEYRNRYIILCIVLSAVFMGVLDTNVVNIALPDITRSFGVDMAESQWVVTAYLLVNTSLLLIFGRLSEYTGKVRLFFAGIVIFTVSSLACGLSVGIYQLIFFRIIQGLGASIVYSINTAMLVQAFPRNERGRALGFIGTIVAIGSIAGPILGGLITDSLGWQYIFFINVPVGVVLVAAALKYLRLSETPTKIKGMDWSGAAALILTMSSLMLLLGSLADCNGITLEMWVYSAIFLASIAAFVYAEGQHPNPIIDLSAFKVKAFTFANMSTMISFTAFSMFIISMPFFLEISLGYTASQVGQMLLAIPLITAVVAPMSGWLYDKFQSTYHSSLGMLIMAGGMFLISVAASTLNPIFLLACFAIFGFGNALFTSPNNTEVMSALPLNKSGTASSMLATIRNFGNSVGISLASVILYLQLRQHGFSGQVISASPVLMQQAVQVVLIIGGVLCLCGVCTSLIVGRQKSRQNKKQQASKSINGF